MHYSSGNYEAFIGTEKPEDVDNKSACIVGSGLAALAAAVFLIRDGHMKGGRVHVLEELALPGGNMDATCNVADQAYVMHGGREAEPHFETLWDLFRSIPLLDYPDQSISDEFYRKDRKDPCYLETHAIKNRGQELPADGDLLLSPKAVKEILNLVMTPEKNLQDKKINEVFDGEFFKSNFWSYWQTMLALMPWASAMEVRCYLVRFVQHVATLKNLFSLRFTKHNQCEDLTMPLISYLRKHGVKFHYDTIVGDIIVNRTEDEKVATEVKMTEKDEPKIIKLTPNDLAFITNGSITESTICGDNTYPAGQKHKLGPSWQLWENLATQDEDFGHPGKFCENISAANRIISATVTFTNDDIVSYIERANKRDPHSGSIVTSGPTTIRDFNWLLGYSISCQPQFHKQEPDELTVWLYGLYSNAGGNYVKETMLEYNGIELCEEWLYHMGVPESEVKKMAIDTTTTPNHMPYITPYFMPRTLGDCPKVIPKNSKNLTFIGNFVETEGGTVFATEYSVHTTMEAVYTLFSVDRGVPEIFTSTFDMRMLMSTMYYLNDRKKLTEFNLPLPEKLMVKEGSKKVKGTYIEGLLRKYKLI